MISVLPFSVTTGHAGPNALEVIPTVLPEYGREFNLPAEVALSPDSEFLLVSNRGRDTLAVYRVDALSGRLTPVAFPGSGGHGPRHFAFTFAQGRTSHTPEASSPDGNLLLVGNSDSGSVPAFSFNAPEQEDVPGLELQLLANVSDAPGAAAVAVICLQGNDAPKDSVRFMV